MFSKLQLNYPNYMKSIKCIGTHEILVNPLIDYNLHQSVLFVMFYCLRAMLFAFYFKLAFNLFKCLFFTVTMLQ